MRSASSYVHISGRLTEINLKQGLWASIWKLAQVLSKTSLDITVVGFFLIACLNFGTSVANPSSLLSFFGNSFWGAIPANFVFDSWGTLAGLLGSVILFTPVLLGTPPRRRRSLSEFFLMASVIIGVGSSLLWNSFFRVGAGISYGSSAIDIAAQSIIFTLSIYALIESFFDKNSQKLTDPYIRNSFRIIYATLVVTTLWFILQLEPIFLPTDQFNWRVHEIAFLSGIVLTSAYLVGIHLQSLGSQRKHEPRTVELASGKLEGLDSERPV